jgi:MOSC domain-containing protein YiiM
MQKKLLSIFLNRNSVNSINLDENGVIGDRHYGKDPLRSILITSIHSYEIAKNANIELGYGDLGENILVNFNPYALKQGTKIAFDEVVLEISNMSSLCKSLTKLDSKLPKLLKNDRGIFAKVIKGGVLKVGENITIL